MNGQAGSALSRVGGAEVTKNTYAMRMEKATNGLECQLERLENALQRAHGTPSNPRAAEKNQAIQATLPVSVSLERLEAQVRRVAELVCSVEEIA